MGQLVESLKGKIAVVTGGSSGIGKGIATRLRDAGATVVISGLNAEALEKAAAELGVDSIQADVADPQAVQRLADETVARYGTVHIIVNNAGVGSMGRVSDLTLADWKWMLDVNLWGVIHGIKSFLPILRANPEGGHVINTASMAGFDTNSNMAAYTAAKMGVVGLTEVLAKECVEDGGAVAASVIVAGPVTSNIKDSLRSRPAGESGGLFDVDASQDSFMASLRWMDPLEVGDLVLDALETRDVFIVTHPELWPPIEARFAQIKAAFGQLV